MFTLNCKGRLLSIDQPVVMGILNITPDSFYAGSRFYDDESVVKAATKMIEEGAAIIDIGGQSTRPGAEKISEKEEIERVVPAIEIIKTTFPDIFISIDTYYSSVANHAVKAGADMVNDISAGLLDSQMPAEVARLNVPIIAMHMKGDPQTMQKFTQYENIIKELIDYFTQRIKQLESDGIKDIIIDPGFGFAKTIEQNFFLLSQMEAFRILNKPVLAGLSRKSMIYKTLHLTPEEALNGTSVLNTIALTKGASILRVHDVKEAAECIKLTSRLHTST
ncbi:MAG: dihydropteroate synthase [Bacteroidota bacterium]